MKPIKTMPIKTMPIKTLFVSPSLQAGGAEKHLVRVLNHLDRQRFDLTLALHRGGEIFEQDLAADVETVVLQPDRPMSSFHRMLRSVAPLRRWIEQHRPQVVCALQNHAAVAALQACRQLRQPTLRPAVAVVVQNNLSQKFARQGWRPTSRLLQALMSRLYRRASSIVAASQGVADDVEQRFPGAEARLEVIYNAGFDRGEVLPPSRPRPRGPLLVACGRLIEQKGFDLLIEAVSRLPADLRPHLWILGEGPLRSKLQRQAQRLGLNNRLWLAGHQPDPRPYMSLADLFVLPSRWEGFGNVLVEAMACGTPVVASDCPSGPREILDHGQAGCLVPPEDVNGIAQAIAQLLHHPSTAQDLGCRGRQRAEEFSTERAAQRYGDLIQRLSQENSHRTDSADASA